jgi:drug/metabolite transporter (DMT)-like permease
MSWILYAFVGITIWSATAVADQYFLLRHVSSKRFYVLVPALLQFSVLLPLAVFFSVPNASLPAIIAALMSGAAELFLLYYLFVAIGSDEVSRVFPLTTAGPIFTLLLGWLILHESLTSHQLLAVLLFVAGGFILAAKLGGTISFSKALRPLFIASLLTSIFILLLRYSFVSSDFWTGFFYSRLGFFIAGIVLFCLYREEILRQWRKLRGVRTALIANQLVALSGHGFYFLALSLAGAALVQSVLSTQSAIVFLFAIAVSYWKRDALAESLIASDLLQKAAGILLVIAASYLLIG